MKLVFLLFLIWMDAAQAQGPARELLPTEAFIVESPAKTGTKKKGSSSSIGTDALDPRTQAAWFYGSEPVITCFNQLESFGASEKTSRAAIESAIQNWQNYFKKKSVTAVPVEQTPNSHFKFIGKCKGDEDLVIFLGTGPIFGGLQDLKAVEKLNFPVAYSNKTHISRDRYWGKGYIRLVANGYYGRSPVFPDWRKPGRLEAILTHELGHVLGLNHIPNTLMQAELVDLVFDESYVGPVQIDQGRELITCESCEVRYRLRKVASQSPWFQKLGFSKDSVELLKTSAGYQLAQGTKKFLITETARSSQEALSSLVSLFDPPQNSRSLSWTLFAYLQNGGQKNPIVFEFNTPGAEARVLMRALQDGEIQWIGSFDEL